MLLCSIIDRLEESTARNAPFVVRFSSARPPTSRINNATAVLQGMHVIYLLVVQQPSRFSRDSKLVVSGSDNRTIKNLGCRHGQGGTRQTPVVGTTTLSCISFDTNFSYLY